MLYMYVHAGQFAVWGLLFSTFDCSLAAIRRKEDPWNAIGSGAITGGLLAIRGANTNTCVCMHACILVVYLSVYIHLTQEALVLQPKVLYLEESSSL